MTTRVLIVDAAFPRTQDIALSLKQKGFEVLVATNAFDTLTLCCRDQADIVLIDANQPGLDALELCRTLKNDPLLRRILVVMMTEADQPALRFRTLDAGADECLCAPFSDAMLGLRLDSVAALRRLTERPEPVDLLPLKVLLLHADGPSSRRIEHILSEECEIVTIGENDQASLHLLGSFDVIIREDGWRPAFLLPLEPQTLLLLDKGAAIPDGKSQTFDDIIFRPIDRSEVLSRIRLAGRKHRLMRPMLLPPIQLFPNKLQETSRPIYSLRAAA